MGDGIVKQLIALAGRPNVGKSTTINKVYELLLANYPNAKVLEKKGRVEVLAAVTINKKRIGIASKGDRRIDIEIARDFFARYKCEIILCATRTSGGSLDSILELGAKHKYDINCIPKIAEQILTEEKSNKKCAKLIVSKIVSLL